MSSNLSSFFRFGGQKMNSDQVQTKDLSTSAVRPGNMLSNQSLSEIKQLIAGQTVSGEVLSIKGNEVELLLDKGGYLKARIDSELNLMPGKLLSFEVKQNLGSQIILRPLFENLEQYPNVNKAIEAAGIPQTDRAVELVKELMRQGMPVDKNTLQNLNKVMLHFTAAEPADLVQMTKLNLPITSETISQFEQYKNLEHSVLKNVMDIAEQFADSLGKEIQTQIIPDSGLFQKLSSVFFQGTQEALLTEQKLQNVFAQSEIYLDNNSSSRQVLTSSNSMFQDAVLSEASRSAAVLHSMNASAPWIEAGSLITEQDQWISNTAQNTIRPQNSDMLIGSEELLKQILSGELPPESVPDLLHSKELNPYQLFRLTQEILSDQQLVVHEAWKSFVKSSEFQNILKDVLQSQWLIEPDQVAQEGKISNLYETMHAQTLKLSQMLAAMDEKYSPLLKQVNSLTQNVEFMNHLNQVFQYVQLPIKMADETAHGELYVYTRKKNITGSNDTISAFLHLDMEHLGKVDVYVTLQGEKVNTNFKLEDEACLKLIEDHLSILDDHLQKRGYQLHADLSIADSQVNLIKEMISREKVFHFCQSFHLM